MIGAGTMGGGIAICFANAGLPVTILDASQAALDRGLKAIGAHLRLDGEARPADAGGEKSGAWR